VGCPIFLGQPILKNKSLLSRKFTIKMKLNIGAVIVSIHLLFSINSFITAQTYFGINYLPPGGLYKYSLSCNCTDCCEEQLYSCCNSILTAQTIAVSDALSISPDGHLFGLNGELYEIDTLTGNYSVYFDMPPAYEFVIGLIAIGNGIFYTMLQNVVGSGLIEINTNTGNITNLGSDPIYPCHGDIALANNIVYYPTWVNNSAGNKGIASFSVSDPTNITLVMNYPSSRSIRGITPTDKCNIFLGTDVSNNELVLINLFEGSITTICNIPSGSASITSLREFEIQDCEILLDLDCDDSSGAPDADYNAPEFTCLSNGVQIADEDIKILYDFLIVSMMIQIVGNIPDAPLEVLDMTGNAPNINASGVGTDMITLSNTGGAKSTDFIDALHLILYQNTAEPLTPGPRTVQVQFTTESGAMSNIATAFIDVIELPQTLVDLGPDKQACDGETATFDAGVPGAVYTWSTGSHNQTITVGESGEYIVTVTDGVNCPGHDTVELDILPIVHVSLDGDVEICDNQQANLIINTNTPFALSVDISSDPGSPFNFPNVNGNFPFTDLPTQTTTYTISNVTPSQDACIEITDPVQVVEVHPTYVVSVDASICAGDSIFLGFFWESDPGVYENALSTYFGCDSVVTTTLTVLPAIQFTQSSTTCDSASAGVFITFLNNPNGCDTIVTTTVTLLPSDIILINLLSCNISSVGTTTQTLTNQSGCDSLIITTTSWIPPADTTLLSQTTCDSSSLGVYPQFLIAQDGCDSIVITTVTIAPSDTTYLSGISCDSASIGVFQNLLSNQMGCDSLVITTISAGMPDTTMIFKTSCDSSSLGVTEIHYTTAQSCDSLVVTTVSFSAQDSTFITGSSCNPADVGVFVEMLANGFGCDSIVTKTVSLLPSSESFVSSSTCDPSAVGNFDHVLVNHFGCDSIVHVTISLLPSSTTFLSSATCTSSQAGTFVTTLQNQYGCDSIVTLTVLLIPADTTQLISKTCDPAQVGSTQNTFTNQDGCDSLVIQTTELFPLPQLNVQVTSDFNGYGISCFGESDGSAVANVTGVIPFQYSWSTGSPDQSITGLSSGDYFVTITDGNGCQIISAVFISEPEEFSIGFEVAQPDCFGHNQGTITVMQTGGVLPIRYSIDGINFQSSPVFNGLNSGTYTVTALDANDCDVQEIIWINVPLMVHVDIGADHIILPGDTVILEAIVNVPFDSLSSITWSGLINPFCPTCLTQPVAPIITTAYSISVSNSQGCSDQDSVVVYIQKNIDIYIPNVFSPNGDGINDRLLISAASDVEKIESMEIFDRWGNLVFAAKNFLPDDPTNAWDGKMRGAEMNPGVYAYKMMARFKDGRREIRNGDITLIR
jgi:gliding motility-associated-like protein